MDENPASMGRNGYTDQFEQVYAKEAEYLRERRQHYGIASTEFDHDLWGISFSGGGIRSASFGLGVMQTLMSKSAWFARGVFRRFDYMSTVSGGGYIGSCLTSLLTPDHQPKGFEHLKHATTSNDVPSVEPATSPFVGWNENRPDQPYNESNPINSVRHQLHHLRAFGNYLISNKSLFSFHVLRFVGTAFYGALFNTVLLSLLYSFCIALLHFSLLTFSGVDCDVIDDGEPERTVSSVAEYNSQPSATAHIPDAVLQYGQELNYDPLYDVVMFLGYTPVPSEVSVSYSSLWQQLTVYLNSGIWNPITTILEPLHRTEVRRWMFAVCLIGFLWVWGWRFVSDFYVSNMIRRSKMAPDPDTPAGETSEVGTHRHIAAAYVWISTLFAVTLAVVLAKIAFAPQDKLLALLVPCAFALGGVISSLFVISYTERFAREMYRFTRSVLATIKGATVYGLIASVALPLALIFGLSVSHFSLGYFGGLLAYLLSFLLLQKGSQTFGRIGVPTGFFARHYKRLLNVLLGVLLIMLIAPFTKCLLNIYPSLWSSSILHPSVTAMFCIALIVIALCLIFDLNRFSPFNFYRDRLTEAYLQTNARVDRGSQFRGKVQGKPLRLVRNDDSLLLKDIAGERDFSAPYHLINAALNLQGSDELIRNSYQSDHFLFSKYFVGSRTTGYVSTSKYMKARNNRVVLRLSRAMTISGAAASSSMGVYSFGAQAFLMTLFNLRLGQWLPNPWWYNDDHRTPAPSPTFWLPYFVYEILRLSNARRKYLNLSDGGHTGDNIGLLTLLQRRCRVIVVVAADDDPDGELISLNNALQMAKVEENIRVDIDTHALTGSNPQDAVTDSQRSVAIGTIHYPDFDRRYGDNHHSGISKGLLIYIRASLNEWAPEIKGNVAAILDQFTNNQRTVPEVPVDASYWQLPSEVRGYKKRNSEFPNQSTGDQFFDVGQFEAYRALGEHCARQVLPILHAVA